MWPTHIYFYFVRIYCYVSADCKVYFFHFGHMVYAGSGFSFRVALCLLICRFSNLLESKKAVSKGAFSLHLLYVVQVPQSLSCPGLRVSPDFLLF